MRLAKVTPLLLMVLCPLLWADRPGERARGPEKVDNIAPEEAAEVVETFRNQRLAGDYIFIFDLEHRPQRAKKQMFRGIMWGTWNQEGPISRISIWPTGNRATATRELLVQGGPNPRIWELKEGKVVELDAEEQGKPFFEGIVYSPYDILMPFTYWEDYDYIGSKRMIQGRPAHGFKFHAPEDVSERVEGLESVEMWLDADFYSPIRAAMLDADGDELRTMGNPSFKEIREQYIVKEVEIMDERTRDYTIFRVTNAALQQHLDPAIFTPEGLDDGEPDIGKVMFDPV
ncbi:MAG: outer membrane lipoprotein-sorting protein [Puniceicoccales bacterium]